MDKEAQSENEQEETEATEEIQTGFPEDIDFKKFLGCGG